jgi:hypothetical protein
MGDADGWVGRYEVDEVSPGPRRLRSGEVREPTYYIFSKQI